MFDIKNIDFYAAYLKSLDINKIKNYKDLLDYNYNFN